MEVDVGVQIREGVNSHRVVTEEDVVDLDNIVQSNIPFRSLKLFI